MLPLSTIFDSQILRIRQQLRQPYQPVTRQPVARRVSSSSAVADHLHGTLYGYCRLACRCLRCRSANADNRRRQRQAQQVAKLAARSERRQADFFAPFTRRAS